MYTCKMHGDNLEDYSATAWVDQEPTGKQFQLLSHGDQLRLFDYDSVQPPELSSELLSVLPVSPTSNFRKLEGRAISYTPTR